MKCTQIHYMGPNQQDELLELKFPYLLFGALWYLHRMLAASLRIKFNVTPPIL